jgi:hypothetical protein
MGWGPAKSLDLRSSAPGGVLQEIELGEKRCHDLELWVFVSHLRKIAKQEIAKQDEVRRPFVELDKATLTEVLVGDSRSGLKASHALFESSKNLHDEKGCNYWGWGGGVRRWEGGGGVGGVLTATRCAAHSKVAEVSTWSQG